MELYNATKKIIQIFNDNEVVNTITTEDSSNIDHNKKNIYPLVNIHLVDSLNTNDIIQTFNYEIIVVQQKEIIKDLNTNKYDNDNTLDNLNECNEILNSFIKNIRKEQYMNLVNQPLFEYLYNIHSNGIDGVRTLISVEVYNNDKFC